MAQKAQGLSLKVLNSMKLFIPFWGKKKKIYIGPNTEQKKKQKCINGYPFYTFVNSSYFCTWNKFFLTL